jgi:hypothetical protein
VTLPLPPALATVAAITVSVPSPLKWRNSTIAFGIQAPLINEYPDAEKT